VITHGLRSRATNLHACHSERQRRISAFSRAPQDKMQGFFASAQNDRPLRCGPTYDAVYRMRTPNRSAEKESNEEIARRVEELDSGALKRLCENSWIPAFAGMTSSRGSSECSDVIPAQAGIHSKPRETRVLTQTLKPVPWAEARREISALLHGHRAMRDSSALSCRVASGEPSGSRSAGS